MKSKFAKTALLAGLALTAIDASADSVFIGCAAPGNTTTGGTVYSVDAYTAAGVAITLPAGAAVGNSCSRALNAMLGGGYSLATNSNVTIQTPGYSLQQFEFNTTADLAAARYMVTGGAGVTVGLVGCAAPAGGSAGGTVYSVDAYTAAGAVLSAATNATIGKPCSQGVSTGYTVGNGITYDEGSSSLSTDNVTIQNSGYSLQQFLIQ